MMDPNPDSGRIDATGRYEVSGVLGEGGMGEVFAAYDTRLGRSVALKVLRRSLAEDDEAVRRFEREARAAASIDHPGIVSIHDIHTNAERPFIVMELCSGRSLDRILEDEGALTPERAVDIGVRVAEALAASHATGLVHRDIKPANILVLGNGDVKVADFGIAWARPWTPISGKGMVQGTPAYYSPEQALGDPIDGRSDVYSLGVVLYEVLSGEAPHSGENAVAVAVKHINVEPRPLAELVPDAPQHLVAVVSRCLNKDPSRRFAAAGDLAMALRGCGSEAPIAAKVTGRRAASAPTSRLRRVLPATLGRMTTRPERRERPWAAAGIGGAAGALAVAVVAAGLWSMLWHPGAAPVSASKPLGTPSQIKAAVVCSGFLNPQVTVDWRKVRDSDGYAVYRRDTIGAWEKVDLVTGSGTSSWSDSSVDSGTTYLYEVMATRGSHVGQRSRMVTADTPSFCA